MTSSQKVVEIESVNPENKKPTFETIYNSTLSKVKEKVSAISIRPSTLHLIIKYVMEEVEETAAKGAEQKEMALKLIRALVVDLTKDADEEVLLKLIDDFLIIYPLSIFLILYLSISFSLFAYVLTKVSVTIYAGGIVVSELLNIDFWVGAIGIVIFTGAYTILGGLRAVVYTETLQTVVLIMGSVIITYLGFQEVGGWTQLTETVTQVSPEHFNMWRPWDGPDFPWAGLLFGGTIVGIWYWCTD